MTAPDRWPISVFGDEIASRLEDQISSMRAQNVLNLEPRAVWDVNVVDLGPEQLARAKRLLDENGIGVSAIGSPVGKIPIEGDFDDELVRLERAMVAANKLGTTLIRVFSFFILDGSYQEHRDEVLHRMTALATRAAQRGLTLVHENESYIYGDTAERCLDLVEAVGSPALRVAFDPANFVQVGVKPLEAWQLLSPYVAHFHVKDAVPIDREGIAPYPVPVPGDRLGASVRPAGLGQGDIPELLRELTRSGYGGYLTIEPHLAHHLPDLDGAGRFELATTALRRLLDEVPKR